MYDLAVVGAGIVGIGHALAAARRGKRVIVLERDARPNGASIRNFGLVTVTGQDAGSLRRRALRSRDIWLELAPQAGISILQRGVLFAAQRQEALSLLEAYKATNEGNDCILLTSREIALRQPQLYTTALAGGLYSPHELRVESYEALSRLVGYLANEQGVEFRFNTAVNSVEPSVLHLGNGTVRARKIVVCPGDDLTGLLADRIAARNVTRCKLQMMRLADPGFRLSAALASDLSLLRYGGFASLPEAANLRRRVEVEATEALAHGIHLVVVQSADGSLVIGDSHHYDATPDPFASEAVDKVILREFATLFGGGEVSVMSRWTGSYASSAVAAFVDAPHTDIRLAMVTSGTGASTGFAIGEETIADLFD